MLYLSEKGYYCLSKVGSFAGVRFTDVQEHPSLVSPGLCSVISHSLHPLLLPWPIPSRKGPALCFCLVQPFSLGSCSFCWSFFPMSWAGFVWGGGISFLCKHREVCTVSVWIAGMSCFFIPVSISSSRIVFSVCFVSCRTKLLTESRSPSSSYGFFWGV